jgi:isopenicillin N synthase-like dioxygenase
MPGNKRTDYKESFVWGLDPADDDPAPGAANPFRVPNLWPESPAGLRDGLYPFLEHAQGCAVHLMQAFAVALGAPRGAFLKTAGRPISRASIVHYPPQPADLGEQQFGVGAHTDFGCLTILCQDDVGGLQVLNAAGEWVTAHPIEGTLVVNVGDLMARWSNDRFRSTPHRVVNASEVHRYSLVAAYDPDAATLVDPGDLLAAGETPRHAPVTCGAYITERFDRSFAYRQ